jgi:hypothetical protein
MSLMIQEVLGGRGGGETCKICILGCQRMHLKCNFVIACEDNFSEKSNFKSDSSTDA